MTVTNRGPGTAADARVTDTSSLPLQVLTVRSRQGTCQAGRPLTCALGTLEDGAHVTITVVAKAKAAGEQINAASVASASRETNPSNNLSRVKTKITPVLRLHKTASPAIVHSGYLTTYAIKVTNPTDITLHGLQTCDALPGGLRLVSGKPRPRLSHGKYCWKLATLQADKSHIYRITVRTILGIQGSVINQATTIAAGTGRVRARAKLRVIAASPPPPGLG